MKQVAFLYQDDGTKHFFHIVPLKAISVALCLIAILSWNNYTTFFSQTMHQDIATQRGRMCSGLELVGFRR